MQLFVKELPMAQQFLILWELKPKTVKLLSMVMMEYAKLTRKLQMLFTVILWFMEGIYIII